MMLINDYYLAAKDMAKKTRYDIVTSTGSYPLFERLLINKKEPNKGGHSLYLVDRPGKWNGSFERKTDKAITKGEDNITSLIIPNPAIGLGYGDIKGTQDAVLIVIQEDWLIIEIFIIRGQKNNRLNLYQLSSDGELDDEMNRLRDLCKKN